jgi:dihydroorotase
MSLDLIIKGATAVIPNSPQKLAEQQLDIGIANGKIVEIAHEISPTKGPVFKAQGLHVLPGLIDTQVHFREPGLTYKEDFESGSRSALHGGITAYFEMPNTKPPVTTLELLQEKYDLSKNRAHTHYAYYGGSTGTDFDQLARMEAHPNSPGIKVFMGTSTGGYLVDQDDILEIILQKTHRRLVVHSEDEPTLQARRHLVQEDPHPHTHYKWRNEESAIRSTQRILKLARKNNRKLHILHITTAEEVEILKQNKDIATFEVLPQHLTLTAPECYERLGTLAQMNPPIRDKRHQDALWKAVLDGSVTIMGSDHAPHTLEEKRKPYPESPSGIPGVQTTVPLMLNFVNQGKLPLTRFVELMAENPKRLFNIRGKGRIEIGADADLTIVDMKEERTLENKWIKSKCGYTPYDGMKLKGWPKAVVLNGEIVLQDDVILKPAQGRAVIFEK